MKSRLILAALAVLSAWPVQAAPDAVVRQSVAVCDPYNPKVCIRPNADGSMAVTGGTGGGGGGSGGAVYGPNAIGAAAGQPPIFNGFVDASNNILGVSPTTRLPAHDYDQRATSQTLSAAAGSVIDIPLNGAGEVGLRFAGLTASGATITYYSSNDATQTPTSPISALNASTGVTSPTRTTDGETRIPVSGRTTLRLQVTTAGTGSITVSYNVTTSANIVDLGSPLPAGSNSIGSIGNAGFASYGLTAVGAAPAAGNASAPLLTGFRDGSGNMQAVTPATPMPTTISDGADVALGAKGDAANAAVGSSAIAIFRQLHLDLLGATFGTATTAAPTYTNNQTAALSLTLAGALRVDGSATAPTTTTTGALQPATAASGKIAKNAVTITANTSTQIAPANTSRIAMVIQCAAGGVEIDETGGTLTSATTGGTLTIPTAQANNPYVPPVASLTAITAYGAAQQCTVTEYNR